MKYPDDAIWWLTFASFAQSIGVLLVAGLLIWTSIETDRKLKFVDERLWNVENAE